MRSKYAFILISVIAMLGLQPCYGTVRFVRHHAGPIYNGQAWNTAFDSVRDAVNVSVSGDEIWVATGTYTENVVLTSGVALYGGFAGTETLRTQRNWTANRSVLDGNWAGPVVEVARSASATTRIDGFTIRNGRAVAGGGVYCNQSAAPIIVNNRITGNSASSLGGGVYCNYGSAPVIANNWIHNNRASRDGGGISTVTGATKVVSNVISGNAARYGGAVCCGDSDTSSTASHEYIVNNTLFANTAALGGGIYCYAKTSASLSNNIIAYNSSGIAKASGSGAPALKKNCLHANDSGNYSGISAGSTDVLSDPMLVSATYGQLHVQPGSVCIGNGNNTEVIAGYYDMDGQTRVQGTVDIGADESDGTTWGYSPTIVRVRPDGVDSNDGSSWASAKQTIQAAIDAAAANGGEVWVKAGTYEEYLTLRDYVYVYGGFAGSESSRSARNWQTNTSVVDARQDGSVVTADSLGYRTSAIDGLTLKNGSSVSGSGILCDHASPVVMNNTIADCSSSSTGGGIYLANSHALVKNNTISNNEALLWGGGICAIHSTSEISSNRVQGNRACLMGGGLQVSSDSPCKIVNNLFVGNGHYPGFAWVSGSAIALQHYPDGGYFAGTTNTPAELNYNTITGNTLNGMAVYTGVYSTIKMRGNIVAFNGAGIRGDKTLIAKFLYNNDVYQTSGYNYSGLTAGTGDISVDPLFVNAVGGDYRLSAGSGCAEAADSTSFPVEDMAGAPRPLDADGNRVSLPDIGCYEYARGFNSAGDAPNYDDDELVALTGMVSTAKLSGVFYLENSDRSRGIGVLGTCSGPGKTVTVEGVMTTSHGERMISAYNVISGGDSPIPTPIAMPLSALGGGAFGQQNPVFSWKSGSWMTTGGANNIGLLVRTFGKVVAIDEPNGCFFVDDGSGLCNFTGSTIGVKVKYGSTMPTVGQDVMVTGIASCESDPTAPDAAQLLPVVLTRQASDVAPI